MPRWYYGWNVIATGMTFQAIAFGLTLYTYGLWVTPLGETFGASRAEVMIGFTLLSVVMGALSPFAGRAMDRRNRIWTRKPIDTHGGSRLTGDLRNRSTQVRILSGALFKGSGFRSNLRNCWAQPRFAQVAPNRHLCSQAE